MIRTCEDCHASFDDEFRTTICPHETFAANDGQNNFAHHPESHYKMNCNYGASNPKMVYRITRSQQMAILDVIMGYLRMPDHAETFINCSTSPATETTVGDLLTLFSDMSEQEGAR